MALYYLPGTALPRNFPRIYKEKWKKGEPPDRSCHVNNTINHDAAWGKASAN